jgi:hypothetical protein
VPREAQNATSTFDLRISLAAPAGKSSLLFSAKVEVSERSGIRARLANATALIDGNAVAATVGIGRYRSCTAPKHAKPH